ncbi:MAG: 2TM domain-containing protein [Cyanobacteria bacterium P01_E01_bin.35]
MSKKYSNEDVQDILRIASVIQQDGDIDQEQLQNLALEVGISPIVLQQAEQSWSLSKQASQKQAQKKSRFIRFHLIPYLTVSIFLVVLNLMTTPQDFWSVYPILGWGLGVALDGTSLVSKKEQNQINSSNNLL